MVPAERAYPLPAGVDAAAAAVLLHPAGTAWLGLFRHAGLRLGETVVIEGAGGGVGGATVQLAAAAGARVVATCAADDVERVLGYGADLALDYRAPGLAAALADAVECRADVWWDNSGRNRLDVALPLLAPRARVLLSAGLGGSASLDVGGLYTRDASLLGFAISNAAVADLADAARVINDRLARGALSARIGGRYLLADAPRAHRDLADRRVRGRLLLVPS